MSRELPIPALGVLPYRVLHSFFLDALMMYREDVRAAVLESLEGVRFEMFLLRLADPADQRLRVRVKPEGEDLWIGLDFLHRGDWVTALEVQAQALGLDPEVVMKEQQQRMDAALEDILGGAL